MPLIMPNTIENDTPADAVEVEQNYNVIEQYVNANCILRDGSVSMIAQLHLVGDPLAENDAVRKGYVDALLPVGVMLPYGGQAAPAGQWALCNGASVQTALMPQLFAVIGYRFGGSGGSFNLPNMADRVPIGMNPAVPAYDTTGKTGGNKDAIVVSHAHSIDHGHAASTSGDDSPDHGHSIPETPTGGGGTHSHYLRGTYESSQGTGFGEGNVADISNGGFVPAFNTNTTPDHGHMFSGATVGASARHQHSTSTPTMSGSSGTVGGAATNANLPPYLVVNYLIRVG